MKFRVVPSFVAAVTILVAAVVVPIGWLDLLASCPFRTWTGWPCPGCGLTHACVAVGHLELAHAWAANPAVFAVIPLIAWFALEPWWRARLSPRISARILRCAAWLVAASLLGAWGYRLACERHDPTATFSLPR